MPRVKTVVEQAQANVWALSGKLDKEQVPARWSEGAERVQGATQLTVDLSRVTRCDSAGVAMLVDWLRLAAGQGTQLRYRGAPEQVVAIARVSDLESLLLQDEQGSPADSDSGTSSEDAGR